MDITRKGDHITVDIHEDRKCIVELYRINFGGTSAFVVKKADGSIRVLESMADAVLKVCNTIEANLGLDEAERFLRYLAS